MTEKAFVDTNILVYACDTTAGPKRERAAELLKHLWDTQTGQLSTQVLQEFYANVTKKLREPVSAAEAREIMTSYRTWIGEPTTLAILVRASELSEVAKISFWDGLIIAAAEKVQADILYTEDLNHGQVIAGIKIVNPFIAPSAAKT